MINRFDITPQGQQIHISSSAKSPPNDLTATRHPCFKLKDQDALNELQRRIYGHFESKSEGAPMAADKPGKADSGMFT